MVVGSLLGASGFPLAAIGLIYFTVAQSTVSGSPGFPPDFDRTWFNIAISLLIISIIGFLLLAYLIYINTCHKCISAKKAVIVSLIFLCAGWATWSLGRLLYVAIVTFQYSMSTFAPLPLSFLPLPLQHSSLFPSSTLYLSLHLHVHLGLCCRQLLHRFPAILCFCSCFRKLGTVSSWIECFVICRIL